MGDLRDLKGKFVTVDGGKPLAVNSEAPSEDFWIITSYWQDSVKMPGAMQRRCTFCNELVGVSPDGQKHIETKPDRIICCVLCFQLARVVEAALERLQEPEERPN